MRAVSPAISQREPEYDYEHEGGSLRRSVFVLLVLVLVLMLVLVFAPRIAEVRGGKLPLGKECRASAPTGRRGNASSILLSIDRQAAIFRRLKRARTTAPKIPAKLSTMLDGSGTEAMPVSIGLK
jgi:hypothetical protein